MMIEIDPLDRLDLGDHVCLIHDDDATRTRALVAYIAAGLRANHRILYYGPGRADVETELVAQGHDAAAAVSRGQLRTASPESTYLASGMFDAEAVIQAWRDESERALAAGYAGLRAIGDMSWASRPVPGANWLPWYEAQVNRVFADGHAMALCLYDRRLFSAADLRRIGWSHPAAIEPGADLTAVPQLRAVRTTQPRGVRLHGEADLSNRHALRAVLDHLAEDMQPDTEPLTVDVSGLRFADAAAARILIQAASNAERHLRVVGCTPALHRLLVFNGADAVSELTVEAAA